jgi:dihydrofolate reductase
MRRLMMFNNVTLDGFFTDRKGSTQWAHERQDEELKEFTSSNASQEGALVFGRITYEEMVDFWPTPEAHRKLPAVAKGMNEMAKFVFSKTLEAVTWNNTTLLNGDPVTEVRRLKKESGPDLVIMGSGSLVSPLAAAGLIDEYQFMVHPVVLGEGRTLFEGGAKQIRFKRTSARNFKNGNVFVCYQPM